MNKITLAFAAGILLGGFGPTAASAAPAMPAVSQILAGEPAATEVAYRHRHRRHGYGYGMRRSRMMSDPNSRNPSRSGFQQQKGTTSGGPRY